MAKTPGKTAPFLLGAIAGALALAIVGFSWGGWMTGYTANGLAAASARQAVVASLTPICVAQFRKDPKAMASLKAMSAIERWQRAEYIQKGGWATMPGGGEKPARGVAAACADALIPSSA